MDTLQLRMVGFTLFGKVELTLFFDIKMGEGEQNFQSKLIEWIHPIDVCIGRWIHEA